MKPRVIFFDIGQTLATGAAQSPRRLLGSLLNLSEKGTKRAGKLIMTHPATEPSSLAEALQGILPDRDPGRIRSAVETLWAEQLECAVEIPGAAALLDFLKSEGVGIGAISNIWHPFYRSFCRNCPETASLIDYPVLSYREGVKKPSPDIYQRALKISGQPAALSWMVGDTYELDMEPAREVGINTLWVLCRPEKEKDLLAEVLRNEKPRPDWVVKNLDEIFPFFQRMLRGSL